MDFLELLNTFYTISAFVLIVLTIGKGWIHLYLDIKNGEKMKYGGINGIVYQILLSIYSTLKTGTRI